MVLLGDPVSQFVPRVVWERAVFELVCFSASGASPRLMLNCYSGLHYPFIELPVLISCCYETPRSYQCTSHEAFLESSSGWNFRENEGNPNQAAPLGNYHEHGGSMCARGKYIGDLNLDR